STREGGQFNLYWKAADGTGQVERLTKSPNSQWADSFSPDGKSLVFIEQNPETSYDLHLLAMEGERTSKPLVQTQFAEVGTEISPEGGWMAYMSNESGQLEIYVRPFPNVDEGKWQISSDGGREPVWGPQGQELFYRNGETMMVVRIKTEPIFTAGNPEVLFTGRYVTRGGGRQYDISPDGQRFLMIKEAGEAGGTSARQELIIVQNWFEELKRLIPTGK
ncbi:hypothetical protein MYX75_07180, partial [Acidobacteria bacterium AH-259-A15]|nr:hypothetical protein [Acidobacteria bacterium AH-259-A15]